MAARYAIYYVPAAASALCRFGASVLGYDAYTGHDVPYPDGADRAVWPLLTREPRLYGFHATMKPPMRLKDGLTEHDLAEAFFAFVRAQAPVEAGALVVRELGAFIALVPAEPCAALNRLADACVRHFDSFRALMTEQELSRRLTPGLSDRQIEHLYRWGYPHVFDDFRFHMTLTGSLAAQKRTAAFRFLCEKFGQVPGAAALTVDRLVVSRQTAPGAPFVVLHEAALGASA
jgi:putative phosphonate metabolism protein